jgi:hypothetical protein
MLLPTNNNKSYESSDRLMLLRLTNPGARSRDRVAGENSDAVPAAPAAPAASADPDDLDGDANTAPPPNLALATAFAKDAGILDLPATTPTAAVAAVVVAPAVA